MKFGGKCVEDGYMIRRSSSVVKEYVERGWRVVAVVSAMAGITDSILNCLGKAERGDLRYVEEFMDTLRRRHEEALREAVKDSSLRREVGEELTKDEEELEKLLSVVAYLKEVTPRTRDYALSFGERLSTRLFWGALRDQGVEAVYLTGWEAGIVTDDCFGSARPIMALTTRLVRERLEPILSRGAVPTVTGFVAATSDGIITTLGRGGSDYTATIIGASLKVDEVVVWKDVEGIMTADPKLVPEANTIPVMSYEEVTELAYFGAKVMHPLALEPAMKEGVPIRVKSIYHPEKEGTLITKVEATGVVKAVTAVKDAAIVTVSGASMVEAPTISVEVLKALSEVGIQAIMVSQGSSQASISLAIPRTALEKAVRSIKRRLGGEGYRIEFEDDVCVIAAIGAGMRGKPGVAARIFKAVAEEGVNVRMIAQGSSELNISFVVKEEDGIKALKAIHREFKLGTG
ncbi:MAG: aspartate kinase [Thermoprotei archaeon]|nr:MAG: aspartate kinase [Thermoprotei archaeon]